MTLEDLIVSPYTAVQLYGLVFLIGSLTVASLSDLRRMAAQKDFAEVWVVFTAAFFAYDFYRLFVGDRRKRRKRPDRHGRRRGNRRRWRSVHQPG